MSRVQLFLPSTGSSPISRPLQRWRIHSDSLAAGSATISDSPQWPSRMPVKVQSSVVNLVDLSDQIDAELSQEGGNIILCQAEGSLSVGPYNRKDIRPPCISCTARNETNSWAERDSRVEPKVVDMEKKIEMTKTFGKVRKNKQNQRILKY